MKKVLMKVNGRSHQFVVEPDRILLDLLREDLRLTGAKQSCDRKGQCGACTVIVNGRTVRSCITKVANLDGAEAITVEGLGTPDNPHLIQEAYVLSGAIQCGFCIPGMIMATKVLLDKDLDPGTEEIKKALQGNLCRCTGYAKIIDAVKLAARFLRGEITPDEIRPDPSKGIIGVSLPRPSSMIKACGVAEFGADVYLQGALELAVVRSPHAHALIKSIDISAAEKMPGVAGVMTANDIKGTNRNGDLLVLCDTKVHLVGDGVAIVAAETKKQALAAVEAVKVEYELLPVVKTIEDSLGENAVRVHEDGPNLEFSQPQIKGDAEAALKNSDVVVEATFSTSTIHQAPLEPEVSIAYMEGEGEDAKLVVLGRGINIHSLKTALITSLGWENVRYEEPFVGGQFGMKTAFTTEGIAGAAALHFHRPVRYVCSLAESMMMTSKRHPHIHKVRMGADKNGKFTAYTTDFTVESGAYSFGGPLYLTRSLQMLSGPYDIPNVHAFGRLYKTNNASGGAARGAGPPQSNYALESAVDLLARKLDMDPLELRYKNTLEVGGTMSTGEVAEEWPYKDCLNALKPHYDRARKEAAAFKTGRLRRGVGIAGAAFGIGGPYPKDQATMAVEINEDSGLTVYGSAADPGEGNDSMLSQITSYLTGIPINRIRLVTRDTDRTPVVGSASASRITYMAGGALVMAIEQFRQAMTEAKATTYQELVAAGKPTKYLATKVCDTTPMDPKTGQGKFYEVRVLGCQMAEVEVDTETGETRVVHMTAVEDIGKVINPLNVEGQMQGGLDMGVGMALREEYIHTVTTDYRSFKFPTMKTSFPMTVITLETPRKKAPLGAIGVGEFVLLPTSAAVMSAIHDAIGVRVYDLPAKPERVLAALGKK
ncbi:MAG: molybdopterin-dependent oxidoreductase [Syntrophorhabdus aromaticivorans]|uniref:Molybdopterin-dependent oxidoreductase n=1 Tax=Syntrophorhabdus aromaticivorans TaxID=328301 RepID=A0A971S268_9BACT|nr:molybdopterin-dependent oxidoreductase [Syntrophorhabdus aromaticivorans]